MAGIVDRLGTNDNIPVHLLTASIIASAAGWFSNQQIADALDARIQTPLSDAAKADLLAIKTELLAQPNAGARAEYMHKLESIALIMEATNGNAFNDATFRSHLGIG